MLLKHLPKHPGVYLIEGVDPNTPQSEVAMRLATHLAQTKFDPINNIELRKGLKSNRLYAHIS